MARVAEEVVLNSERDTEQAGTGQRLRGGGGTPAGAAAWSRGVPPPPRMLTSHAFAAPQGLDQFPGHRAP
jgi:hypothetical protein